jgi:hypothetical protein
MVEVASDGMSWDVIEILPPYDGIMSCILLSMTRVFKEKVNVTYHTSAISIEEKCRSQDYQRISIVFP